MRGAIRADTIRGGDGNDNIGGLEGDDSLDGGAGRDRVNGGDGNDTILAGTDIAGEALLGGAGFDLLAVNTTSFVDLSTAARLTGFEHLSIAGAVRLGQRFFEGIERLTVSSGAQLRAADAGAWALGALDVSGSVFATLTFIGSTGADLITGIGPLNLDSGFLLANDSILAGAGDDTVFGDGGNDRIFGEDGDDRIFGENGADSLFGELGSDSLDGGEGNDTLDGGAGLDTQAGGFGDDFYNVETFFELTIEAANAGFDTVLSQINWTLAANLERLILGSNASVGSGNTLANRIDGNVQNDGLSGLAGNDTIFGGSGNDSVNGGDGNDSLLGEAGTDSVIGGTGNDTLDGGTSIDTLVGGTGDDLYLVDDSSDLITEAFNAGLDVVQASVGYTLAANVENLVLLGTLNFGGFGNASANSIVGNVGANLLSGADADDTLNGGLGNDTLNGGLGRDSLIGGANDDRFVYAALNESNGALPTLADFIADFQADGRDRIDVSLIDAAQGFRGNNGFSYIGGLFFTAEGQIRAVDDGGGLFTLLFNTDATTSTVEMAIRVQVAAGALDASDFIL